MTILPLLVSLAAQLLVSFAFMAVIGIIAGVQAGMEGITDAWEITEYVSEAVMDSVTVSILLYHLAALAGFGLWYYFGTGKPRPKPVSPRKVFTGKCLIVSLVGGFGMCVAASGLLSLAEVAAPDIVAKYEELMEIAGLGTDPITIIASVLIAPIGEEILCRGVIFHYAGKVVEGMRSRKAAFWIANSLQALMFGIMHGNLVQGSYAFLLGLGLGWLRMRYRSLYPGMLAHFAINFSSTFLLGFLFMGAPQTLPTYVLMLAAGIFVTVGLMWWDQDREASL